MIHLTDGILLVLEYGLAVFCFIDIAMSPEAAVPWIPRWGWIVALLILPVAGSIAWLVAGRPRRAKLRGRAAAWTPPELDAGRRRRAPRRGAGASRPGRRRGPVPRQRCPVRRRRPPL